MVIELKYSGTNTYLVRGTKGSILLDTGWAGIKSCFREIYNYLGKENIWHEITRHKASHYC